MGKKEDRRVRKTKSQLRKTLSQLLLEKPINDITVKELTERTDISRGTFYLHYRDVYDMIEKVEDELFVQLEEILNMQSPKELVEHPLPTLIKVFQYIKNNLDMAVVYFSSGGAFYFTRLLTLLNEKCFGDWVQTVSKQNEAQAGYYFTFVIGGCISLLSSWLETGMRESAEQMAVLAERIIFTGREMLFENS